MDCWLQLIHIIRDKILVDTASFQALKCPVSIFSFIIFIWKKTHFYCMFHALFVRKGLVNVLRNNIQIKLFSFMPERLLKWQKHICFFYWGGSMMTFESWGDNMTFILKLLCGCFLVSCLMESSAQHTWGGKRVGLLFHSNKSTMTSLLQPGGVKLRHYGCFSSCTLLVYVSWSF